MASRDDCLEWAAKIDRLLVRMGGFAHWERELEDADWGIVEAVLEELFEMLAKHYCEMLKRLPQCWTVNVWMEGGGKAWMVYEDQPGVDAAHAVEIWAAGHLELDCKVWCKDA